MASRRTTTTRETKVTSRRAAADETVAETEVKKGMTMGDAVVIVTAILMVAAILLTDYHLGHHFREGIFFKP